jgi:murein DD-endopeptidase MepM/ murein hydrolase activator NlpD
VSIRNDLPENTPPHALANIDLSNALGNHVIVDMGGSRFATYAHMQPGSITVRVGAAVHRGQVLGRVGNTGSSGTPHLHFHITNSALLARSNGVPYEFTGFRLTGKILNLEAWLDQEVSVPADIGPVAPPARRRGQLPLTTDIVTFR